jgi:pantetheine-phosphate adenylyltransferase
MHRIAIYPGSFDPPTLGHLDVIERASRLFDRLIIGVGVNSSKSSFLTMDERVEALQACVTHLHGVEVMLFQGLLIDFVRAHNARAIVRGLRATADFDYEFQMAMVNRRLAEEIETVLLMTKWEHSYLSSSIVREVALLGGEFEGLVPGPVAVRVHEALARRSTS